jgi:hypothetical protein
MEIEYTDEFGKKRHLNVEDIFLRAVKKRLPPDRDLSLIFQVLAKLKKQKGDDWAVWRSTTARDLAAYIRPYAHSVRQELLVGGISLIGVGIFILGLPVGTAIWWMIPGTITGLAAGGAVLWTVALPVLIILLAVLVWGIVNAIKTGTVRPEDVATLTERLKTSVAPATQLQHELVAETQEGINSNIPQAVDITQLQPDAHVGAEKAILHEPRVQIPVSAINNSTLFKTENVTFISENHNTPQVTEIAKLQNSSHVEKEVVRIPDTTPVTTASRVKDSSPQPSYATPHFFEYEEFVQSSESLQNNSSGPTYAKISGLY